MSMKIIAPADAGWLNLVHRVAQNLRLPVEVASKYADLLHLASSGSGCVLVDLVSFGQHFSDMLPQLNLIRPMFANVVVSDHLDVRTTVGALKSGAVSTVVSELTGSEMLKGIDHAIRDVRINVADMERFGQLEVAIRRLSARDLEVLRKVVNGQNNKAIGDELGVSVRTIENARQRIMAATGFTSPLKLAVELGLSPRLRATFYPDRSA